jgi:acyl carrier protein
MKNIPSTGTQERTMSNTLSEATAVKIQDILLQQLGVERAQITPEAAIMADLGADSLDMVEIGMTVEETFNLTIADEDMETVRTVGDLHEVLAQYLEQTGQPV